MSSSRTPPAALAPGSSKGRTRGLYLAKRGFDPHTRSLYYWTDEQIVEAFRVFGERHGRAPTFEDARYDRSLPAGATVYRYFADWATPAILAGLEYRLPYGQHADDEETAELMRRVTDGETLTDVARSLGITGQALGRRIAAYRRAHDLPPLGLRPGRRSPSRRAA